MQMGANGRASCFLAKAAVSSTVSCNSSSQVFLADVPKSRGSYRHECHVHIRWRHPGVYKKRVCGLEGKPEAGMIRRFSLMS